MQATLIKQIQVQKYCIILSDATLSFRHNVDI